VQLTELNIFPIKSTAPIRLAMAEVSKHGLQWDRRWMLVDADGLFITGRKFPQLTKIQTAVHKDSLAVFAPGMETLYIPFDFPFTTKRIVRVWKDICEVPAYGAAIDDWFSTFLTSPCHLVYMPDDYVRPVDRTYAGPTDQTSFSDGFPLLLISQSSLADLNSHLETPVIMDRFRPNLVVHGCDAYAEDQWQQIRVGEAIFKVVKPCSRCIFTTVDPASGVRNLDGEPLKTLSSYRKRADGKVYFGQNLLIVQKGRIKIGDAVELC